jgi:hypothetical protein
MKKNTFLLFVAIVLIACSSQKKLPQENKNTYIVNKYAQILGAQKSEITNIKLYKFINDWIGTKYKYGGLSKQGVDCSGFCNVLYKEIYNKQLDRRAADIAKSSKKVSKNKLQEGDLVFFTISSKKNSHVGVYLKNNKFVHASTIKGVVISSLDNPYYKKTFNKGGKR